MERLLIRNGLQAGTKSSRTQQIICVGQRETQGAEDPRVLGVTYSTMSPPGSPGVPADYNSPRQTITVSGTEESNEKSMRAYV